MLVRQKDRMKNGRRKSVVSGQCDRLLIASSYRTPGPVSPFTLYSKMYKNRVIVLLYDKEEAKSFSPLRRRFCVNGFSFYYMDFKTVCKDQLK